MDLRYVPIYTKTKDKNVIQTEQTPCKLVTTQHLRNQVIMPEQNPLAVIQSILAISYH